MDTRTVTSQADGPGFCGRAGDLEAKVDTEAIEKLMIERAKAKSKRDYETADKIRDELRSVHNIDIFDKQRIWKLRDGAAREQRAAARRAEEDKLEMPALLGEWGCDAELWKAVVSKSALIKLVERRAARSTGGSGLRACASSSPRATRESRVVSSAVLRLSLTLCEACPSLPQS